MSSSLSPEQWTHIDTPFARYLPETALSREQHDTALNRFFRYFASWAIRLSVGTPVKLSSAAPNYSPMLHNAILSLALAYSDEPHLRAVPTRRVYFQEAMRLQDDECVAPNIATIQALALLSSYQSTLGQFDLGWMYFGRAIRACYSMGLHIDTTLLVERDQLPRDLYIQRNNTFWTIFLQEEMWAIYIGRSPFMIEFSTPLPIADTVMDDIPWANVTANSFGSGNKEGSDGIGEQPSLLAATFSRAVGLMRIAHDITKTVYGIKVKGEVSFPLETIRGYHARLNSWLDDLPPTFQVDAGSSAAALPHVIMLHMAWAWIMILLLQPFCQQTSTKNAPPIDETQGEFTPLSGPAAMLSCHHAASRILDLSVLWEHQHDLRFVPPTMTHIVYLAGTTFLLVAARSGPAHASAHALDQAQKCLSTLHGIGQTWSAAFQKAAVLSDLLDDYGKLTRLTSQSRSQRASRSDISLDTQSQRCDTYPSGMTVTNLSTSTSLMGLDGGLRSGFDQLNPTISDLRFDVRDDIHPQSIGNAQPIPEHDVFGNNCLTDLSLDNTFDTSWSGGEFDEFISSVLSQMGPPPTNDWDLMTLLAQPQQSWQQ
uniref:Xylanolytic transcriptional activator regulatory domain-containing protein n=1 Tax=Kwoniella bestiolae CBS 10118 TaxID=1296100 RepID=A0A1B9G3U6_9TREE|nr:hypothetical protein I302_03377 [Kwoniella bestiolae CBS 10118]OCF25704.1 hypothetical protein I302_03377 [Kwoniella bestiolae CBS 10118]